VGGTLVALARCGVGWGCAEGACGAQRDAGPVPLGAHGALRGAPPGPRRAALLGVGPAGGDPHPALRGHRHPPCSTASPGTPTPPLPTLLVPRYTSAPTPRALRLSVLPAPDCRQPLQNLPRCARLCLYPVLHLWHRGPQTATAVCLPVVAVLYVLVPCNAAARSTIQYSTVVLCWCCSGVPSGC